MHVAVRLYLDVLYDLLSPTCTHPHGGSRNSMPCTHCCTSEGASIDRNSSGWFGTGSYGQGAVNVRDTFKIHLIYSGFMHACDTYM